MDSGLSVPSRHRPAAARTCGGRIWCFGGRVLKRSCCSGSVPLLGRVALFAAVLVVTAASPTPPPRVLVLAAATATQSAFGPAAARSGTLGSVVIFASVQNLVVATLDLCIAFVVCRWPACIG